VLRAQLRSRGAALSLVRPRQVAALRRGAVAAAATSPASGDRAKVRYGARRVLLLLVQQQLLRATRPER
jgi:hypothetical protein